jgi:hypothetical protein
MANLHYDQYTFLVIPFSIMLILINASDKFAEEIKTLLLGSVTFFFGYHAVYEILWKIIVESEKQQTTIWRMHIACCIPKATSTNWEYAMLTALLRQQWLYGGASVLCYSILPILLNIFCACKCVNYYCCCCCSVIRRCWSKPFHLYLRISCFPVISF